MEVLILYTLPSRQRERGREREGEREREREGGREGGGEGERETEERESYLDNSWHFSQVLPVHPPIHASQTMPLGVHEFTQRNTPSNIIIMHTQH